AEHQRDTEPGADARPDVQAAAEGAVVIGVGDDERAAAVHDLAVRRVAVVDVEALAEDRLHVGESDTADDDQPPAAQLRNRGTVERPLDAQRAQDALHLGAQASKVVGSFVQRLVFQEAAILTLMFPAIVRSSAENYRSTDGSATERAALPLLPPRDEK